MQDNRKNILAFIDWYRPGYKAGGTVTAFGNMVDHLEENLNFHIVTRDTEYCESTPYDTIEHNKWNPLSQSKVFYVSTSKLGLKIFKRLEKSINYDKIYINGLFSFYFSILPLFLFRKAEVIVNPHGMLSHQAFSIKKRKKEAFVYLGNYLNLYKNVTFHVANDREANDVRKRIKGYKEIKVANQFPRKDNGDKKITKKQKSDVLHLISLARIAPEKGLLRFLKALRNLGKGNVVFDIYGPVYDHDYWSKCQEIIQNLPSNLQVTYRGSAKSSEVPTLLKEYHFFVMPSEGENFGHAILEAFTVGCPAIISDNTPWRELKKKNIGWDVALGTGEIDSALEEALEMDQETYDRWSENAWEFARQVINYPEVLEANKKLFTK